MTRTHLVAFAAGAVLATLLARYGPATTVGLLAIAFPVTAGIAGLLDTWRTRRNEWAGIDARHTTDRILDQERD